MYNRCVLLLLTAQNNKFNTKPRLYSVDFLKVAGKSGNKDGVFTSSTESLGGQKWFTESNEVEKQPPEAPNQFIL